MITSDNGGIVTFDAVHSLVTLLTRGSITRSSHMQMVLLPKSIYAWCVSEKGNTENNLIIQLFDDIECVWNLETLYGKCEINCSYRYQGMIISG